MSNMVLIQSVKLDLLQHSRTGNTRHFRGGRELLELPHELRIEKYQHSDGSIDYYLIHCDSLGNELTDTWHDSLERAMKQAEREFGVQPNEWQRT